MQVEKKSIAVVTPDKRLLMMWIEMIGSKKYDVNEFDFVLVNKFECVRGRYFHDVEFGFESFGVHNNVYFAARQRIVKQDNDEIKSN